MTPLQSQVLSILKERKNTFVSGEIIAEKLSVSRTAVMKAVNSLKENGYAITSVPRLGHRLEQVPDILDADSIRHRLLEKNVEADVVVFQTIDSTNTEGKKRADHLSRPLLLLAEEQTMGRGRQGHSFYSPRTTGLYMSLVVPVSLPLTTIAFCTQAMAVAAARTVEALWGPALQIKWVNDLYLADRKVAGILTEAVTDLETQQATAVICGIGINLTTKDFPETIMSTAGALGRMDRNILAAEINALFLKMINELPDTDLWLNEYRQRSLVLNRTVSFSVNGHVYHAVGKKIDDQGRLVVGFKDGNTMTLSSGEISVIPE